MANKFLDIFRKKEVLTEVPEPQATCLYDSGTLKSLELKEDRSDSVTYSGIGRIKYGTGTPPTIYNDSIAAVRAYPIVYGCITAISEALAALNIKVYEVKGGQKTEVQDHPFYAVFANPNPYQGSFEFLESLQQSLDVCGNAFIAKEKVAGTYELYILNPKYVALIPDPKKKIAEYRYYINGISQKYKPEEIIHLKYSDVDNPYYGMPPLTPASEVLKFEASRLKFANQFFANGAVPVGLLETESVLGDGVLKRLRVDWSNIHQGLINSHRIGILQGGLKYKPITSPIKDLDFSGLKKLSKDDILTVFKIPESILGNQEGTGSNEGKAAITAFWRQCLIPRIKRIESALNRGLKIEVFGQGAQVFEFNLKDVAALQDDKESLAKYLQALVASSIMTPNEARAVVGLPKMDGDEYADKLLVSNSFFGNQLLPVDQAASQGSGSNAEKPAAKPAKTPTKPAKTPTKPKK